MTTAPERLAKAGAATLCVHAARSLLALLTAWPIARDAGHESLTVASVVGLLDGGAIARAARTGSLYVLAAAICAPALAMLWLRALAAPAESPLPVRYARSRYGAALRISLGCLGISLSVVAVACGTALLVHGALVPMHNERVRDLAAVCAALPALVMLTVVATWHDTAHAALALGEPSARAAWRTGRRALSARVVAIRAATAAATFGIFVLGLLVPHALLANSPALHIAAFTVAQALALAMTLLRGLWLATAVACIARCVAEAPRPVTPTAARCGSSRS